LRRLVDPPLRVLIRDGKVDHRNLRRCGLTRADVDAVLRQHGQRSPDRVQLAVYEEIGVGPHVTGLSTARVRRPSLVMYSLA
jgi:uncharacterized membrane protein YcaP (DUF421 family)